MAELQKDVKYYYSGDFYEYIEDVPSMPEFCVVREGDGYLTVVRKSELKPYEESWQWQQKELEKERLEKVTDKVKANLDELAKQVVDKALKDLAMRIKLNVAFGKATGGEAYAIILSNELEKMIRESGKKIAEGKK
jgi:hypothetical protein